MNLKQKALNGFFWTFINSGVRYPLGFIIGVILARLLEPKDFGIIAMVAIVTEVSKILLDSGFNSALIRKKIVSEVDLSTVFIFNVAISIFLYLLAYLIAPYLAAFYGEPIVEYVLKIAALGLIFSALGSIHKTVLTKNVEFKNQSIFSVISLLVSGIVAVTMAFLGYGVWSLVISTLASNLILTYLLWQFSKWRPQLKFSWVSFWELFAFGRNILISYILDAIFRNSYAVVLGKFYSPTDLGFFKKAENFKDLPSKTLSSVVKQVSFPVLSQMQDSDSKLKQGYRKMMKMTMLAALPSLFLLIVISEPFIVVLIGDKWLPSVSYLQLLCVVGMFYPLHSMNVNVLMVKGRSDLFLRIEILKKFLIVGALLAGYFVSIEAMIFAMIVNSALAFFINSYYTGKFINYSGLKQLNDIKIIFFSSVICSLVIYFVAILLSATNLYLMLVSQIVLFVFLYAFLIFLFKVDEGLELYRLVLSKINRAE